MYYLLGIYCVLGTALDTSKSCKSDNQGPCHGTDIDSEAQYWIIKCPKWVSAVKEEQRNGLADNEMELGIDYFTQSV